MKSTICHLPRNHNFFNYVWIFFLFFYVFRTSGTIHGIQKLLITDIRIKHGMWLMQRIKFLGDLHQPLPFIFVERIWRPTLLVWTWELMWLWYVVWMFSHAFFFSTTMTMNTECINKIVLQCIQPLIKVPLSLVVSVKCCLQKLFRYFW